MAAGGALPVFTQVHTSDILSYLADPLRAESAAVHHRLEGLDRIIATRFPIIGVPLKGARFYAQLRQHYKSHFGVSSNRELARHSVDFMLAAAAMAEDAVLVSNDEIFPRLAELEPRLQVANWAR